MTNILLLYPYSLLVFEQNLQALLTAKIRCEQGSPMGTGNYSRGGGASGERVGGGSNVMSMDNDDYGY